MKTTIALITFFLLSPSDPGVDIKNSRIDGDFTLPNVVPPLDYGDNSQLATHASRYIPVPDTLFLEHERIHCTSVEEAKYQELFSSRAKTLQNSNYAHKVDGELTALQKQGKKVWIGTGSGLYVYDQDTKEIHRHASYGVDGPPATNITALALDSQNTLWIGTPVGLGALRPDDSWLILQGRDGLPVESITALASDGNGALWIGTDHGAVLFKPYAEGRQWHYRSGKRYLIDNHIRDIAWDPDARAVFFQTAGGISKLALIERTLAEKADIIERNINTWNRSMGLVGACALDDAENPTKSTVPSSSNDGLWTAYHVVAMSLAYATAGDDAYKESARKGMHALIMLQNATGIPGLPARSVVPISQRGKHKGEWKETPDGQFMWKGDTSSDEIDGHFFAFYAYWAHIAKNDPEEDALIRKQVREMIDYIVDNNYQLIDWDGERTRWGFWNPEALNHDPNNYLENGLNAAQILSFLKVSYYITGDPKYKKHYDYLITEHGYLGNVLLEKKVFPDMNNHSDNQLGFVALYPLLQLEYDPRARKALQQAVRRHYMTLSRDGSAFFYFAAATIDPDFVDIKGAVENLRRIHTDRRQWKMVNSHRKDIVWHPREDRMGHPQLLTVLPADERNFKRWNINPYYADHGDGGKYMVGGGNWLLAYWMGRYHGFIE
jgi:hypothetical protein